MRAAELFEHFVVIGLHADGNAVKARTQQLFQSLFVDAVGIGLERDLRVGVEAEAALHFVKNFLQILRTEEAGRAAAEVDRIDQMLGRKLAGLLDVVGQRLQIVVGDVTVAPAAERIEIAVFTFALAEGDVDVNAQLFLGSRPLEEGKCHTAPPISLPFRP